jgi:hypothetical protein
MLRGSVVLAAQEEAGMEVKVDWEDILEEEGEALEVDGPRIESRIDLAKRCGACLPLFIGHLG